MFKSKIKNYKKDVYFKTPLQKWIQLSKTF